MTTYTRSGRAYKTMAEVNWELSNAAGFGGRQKTAR